MKTVCSLLSVVLLLALYSCDLKTLFAPEPPDLEVVEPDPEPEPVVLPDDADPLSISGQRYEKYYFRVDPAEYNKRYTFSGSAPGKNAASWNNIGNNTINITLPLRVLAEGTTATVNVTGQVWIYWKYWRIPENVLTYGYFASPINCSTSINGANFGRLYEEYDILQSFTCSPVSVALPKTANYSNAYHEYKYFTYAYTFAAATVLNLGYISGLVPPPNDGASPEGTNESAVRVSAETFDNYLLASRDFYQYKTVTFKYSPGLVIHGFNVDPIPHPVVDNLSYDMNNNEITVNFKAYNSPYTGSLFSYWIQAEDGTWREKIVSIQ